MLKKIIHKLIRKSTSNREVIGSNENRFIDISNYNKEILQKVEPFTMTTPERIIALLNSIEHIESYKIQGCFVECGVWKGGSVMAAIYKLLEQKSFDREIWLYDTFEGMSQPTDIDKDPNGIKASDKLAVASKTGTNIWAYSTLEEVKKNIGFLNYPSDKIIYLKGKVEDTLLDNIPDVIALLRLDTDWYESTKIELELLYDKVVSGGIIIIDDYGHWAGCKKAVDEFIANRKLQLFLHRIDYTGRLIVKP